MVLPPQVDRRTVLARGAALCAAALLPTRSAVAADERPVLGLILPPASREIPPEALALYGPRLRFVVNGLGIERMTPDSFDAALARLPAAAADLAARARPTTSSCAKP
jgi:hypothetical protein